VPRKTRINQTQNQQTEQIKIRAEINKIETKQAIQRFSEIKSCFFQNINKINKPLVNMTNQRRKKIKLIKIRGEKGDITKNTNEIQRII
jgi:hypothetical protein